MHSNANLMKKRVLLKDSQNNELYPRPCMPIGSVIFLNNTLDPNTYFMGTWEKIEEEVFFMTASSDFPVGQVSGSNEVTLTIKHIPTHAHDLFRGFDGVNKIFVPTGTVKNATWNTYQDQSASSMSSSGDGQPFDVRPRRYAINAWVRIS